MYALESLLKRGLLIYSNYLKNCCAQPPEAKIICGSLTGLIAI